MGTVQINRYVGEPLCTVEISIDSTVKNLPVHLASYVSGIDHAPEINAQQRV